MRTATEIRREYENWLNRVDDGELLDQLRSMDTAAIEDAFYRDLTFGTGGLRGIIGAGTNRMNRYVVAKASQGLSHYLLSTAPGGVGASVVIGYDSRIKSDTFAEVAAGVFANNGILVHLWPTLTPVPTVSFAVRELHASAGVMITASHNPSKYNGYKVYGADGCQITTEAAKAILECINAVDIFGVHPQSLDWAGRQGLLKYIDSTVMDAFIASVKGQSVLFGDDIDRNVSIVYSPLNGTGLVPVTRVLSESGFTNVTVVEEQRLPDGNFPTCPYPNPEIREAMALGLKYAVDTGADLMLATDPDCDRCGVAVRDNTSEYVLMTGNEIGLLLLDYICNQRIMHDRMPEHPVFVKTIVTTDLAEKVAEHYGVKTINVLTGFKYIGEQIEMLEKQGRAADYICGFEESFGYLTGSYVRDKDGVGAAFMICEMFAFYKTRGVSLLARLQQLYDKFGFCLNTLHSHDFPGSSGMARMGNIMEDVRRGVDSFGGEKVVGMEDYIAGLGGLPASDVLKFFTESGSVVIRPSGTEPKLKAYISVIADDRNAAGMVEQRIVAELEAIMETWEQDICT